MALNGLAWVHLLTHCYRVANLLKSIVQRSDGKPACPVECDVRHESGGYCAGNGLWFKFVRLHQIRQKQDQ